MVSPPAKGGGEAQAPSEGSGVFQAASQGGAFAFGSESSFADPQGAGPANQYVSTRSASGWATQNLTPLQLSGTYAKGAYLAFSADLSRSILTSGWRCRDGSGECEAENPPLGAGAPAGYRNLYLREGATYAPLLTSANSPLLSLPAEQFHLSLVGATEDLQQAAISSCAKLTTNSTEVPLGEGCDPAAQNLYLWSEGTLTAINLLPAQSTTSPGAALAAPSGAISTDGKRVYFTHEGNLYLREGSTTKQPDASLGGGTFQTASKDGSLAYFTKAGHLYRYNAIANEAKDLTPAGEVLGVLGASGDGDYLYYLTAQGLFLHHEATEAKVAAGADESNYPPATGTARVSADGAHIAFISSASLTGYPNVGKTEVFVYEAIPKRLICASCNPKGSTPAGPSSMPGVRLPGEGGISYQARSLSEDGARLFFDSSDKLLSNDTDKAPDVYQWSAQGAGSCSKATGCIGLISSGRIGSASFLDASPDGTDAYFLTATSLTSADPPGALDVYDARSGGGFPEPPPQIPCFGDECQGPPPGPDDPQPGTALLEGPHNPPVLFKGSKGKGKHRKHHHKKNHHKGDKGHHKGVRR